MRFLLQLLIVTGILFNTLMSCDNASSCKKPGNIVFVVDGSDRITDEEFIKMKIFVTNLIDNFEITPDATNVGLVVYGPIVGDIISLFPYKNKLLLKTLVYDLQQPKSGANAAAGIDAARKMISQLGRKTVPNIMVVISNGRSTNPWTIFQARVAKLNGIKILAIGFGQDTNVGELNLIASSPNYVFVMENVTALANTESVTRQIICST
ncbi:matrilin-2-like [Mercenaria mercenaria]|uniref:matrilin-2-like n=1 Tax=Mercenaria mercenaria TaxID=6596 RepID=UPI00234EFCBB|nr:matrilin-2-like [Mercenaria mercenaria]